MQHKQWFSRIAHHNDPQNSCLGQTHEAAASAADTLELLLLLLPASKHAVRNTVSAELLWKYAHGSSLCCRYPGAAAAPASCKQASMQQGTMFQQNR
jgi:hypothetical protein